MKTSVRERLLAPSVLSADFASLGEAVARVAPYSGLLHVDVMDGHFVPNITLGPVVVAGLKRATKLPLDCHLMIEAPDRYLADFAKAGATCLSVHQEACPHLHRTIQRIREEGMRPGVALNPATPIETLEEILECLDFVLIMSVNPGFGGQKFIPSSLDKVKRLRAMIEAGGWNASIEVDGGVSEKTIPSLLKAGADWFVAGSAIFGAPDPAAEARRFEEMLHG
jgi:ribulose-phosphate 3-epimerase